MSRNIFPRLLICGLFLISFSFAQQAEISGFVHDQSGGNITEASISLKNKGNGLTQRSDTNGSGLYALRGLQSGLYSLAVSAPGFETKVLEDLTVEVGAKLTRNIELKVSSASASVTVSDSSLPVNMVDGAVSTVVNRQFVENMPLNGRSFQALLTMVPGVTAVPSSGTGFGGEISVNGQRTEANYFTIDGVSANTGALTITNSSGVGRGAGFSGSVAGLSAIGTTQSLVSVDALQEFRATTSTYSSEYGRTPGGQFSFQTRSGTNEAHGSLFEYFRNDKLDANNWFNNRAGLPRQVERQNDFGGTLGAPIFIPKFYDGRNRTFFFFSYEGLRLRTPQAANTFDVPSLELRQNAPAALQPFLNAFPLPNGPVGTNGLASFTGSYSAPSNLDTTSIRIDHGFSDMFKVFGRYSYSPSSNVSRQTPNLANVSSVAVNVKTLTLGATNIVSARANNDFRFNTTWNDSFGRFTPDNFGGATAFRMSDIAGLEDPSANLFFYMNFGLRPVLRIIPRDIYQTQFNITDAFSLSVGRHNLKFGFDWRRMGNDQSLPSVYEYPVFSNASQILSNTPQFITLFSFAGSSMKPVYHNFSTFVQDEWRVTPRLSLSLGLRWDINPAPKDAAGNDPYTLDQVADLGTSKLAPSGTALWNTRWSNFAPRLGFAYHLRQSAGYDTTIRGGAGLFYDTGNNLGSAGYWGVGISGSTTYTGVSAPAGLDLINNVPAPNTNTPYQTTVYAYDPNLKLPYTTQWNFAVEQGLGDKQSLILNYVGSSAKQLLIWRQYYPGYFGNENFRTAGGFGNTLQLTTNGASSNYHSLQAQFQRRLSRGLQAMASYTWAHSIDTASTNFQVYHLIRGNSDFDVRHNLQVAATYDLPRFGSGVTSALWNGFSLDGKVSARSSLPVDLVGANSLDVNTGSSQPFHPNVVAGQPVYISDSNAPGGRRINFDAFVAAPTGVDGSAGRNYVRGFHAAQMDIALRRHFRLTETIGLQFRAEAFNVLNTPIFGGIYNDLSFGSSRFGYAFSTQNSQLGGLNPIYQTGGPRSIQLALKLVF